MIRQQILTNSCSLPGLTDCDSGQAHPDQSLLDAKAGFMQGQDGPAGRVIQEQTAAVGELAANAGHQPGNYAPFILRRGGEP